MLLSIVEVDLISGKVLWDWLATEHGFTVAPTGELIRIDRNKDYSTAGDIGTRHHTTHINSVEDFDDNHVLATLFHQDELILIDKRTGDFRIVFNDLSNPHGIYKYNDGFMVSDTRGNRVIILDKNFNVKSIVTGRFDWVQDCIKFGNKLVVLNDNHARLEFIKLNNEIVKQISWNGDIRMASGIYNVNGKQAKQIFLN